MPVTAIHSFVSVILAVAVSTLSLNNTNVYKNVDTNEKMIALSFDDGPHPTQTAEILDVLRKYNVKATFFVVGKNAELYPEILRQTVEEGHEIGNHTYSHDITKNNCTVVNELQTTHDLILDICEYNTKLFRPPGGKLNIESRKAAEALGYNIILWNVDTRDWTHKSADDICKIISSDAKNGSIILLHDYVSQTSFSAKALDIAIPLLLKEGYTFVTVSELIKCGNSA